MSHILVTGTVQEGDNKMKRNGFLNKILVVQETKVRTDT